MALTEDELIEDVSAIRTALQFTTNPTIESIGLALKLNGAKTLTYPALRLHIIKITKALGWELARVNMDGHHRFVLRPNA